VGVVVAYLVTLALEDRLSTFANTATDAS
jgi:hypothetical protein